MRLLLFRLQLGIFDTDMVVLELPLIKALSSEILMLCKELEEMLVKLLHLGSESHRKQEVESPGAHVVPPLLDQNDHLIDADGGPPIVIESVHTDVEEGNPPSGEATAPCTRVAAGMAMPMPVIMVAGTLVEPLVVVVAAAGIIFTVKPTQIRCRGFLTRLGILIAMVVVTCYMEKVAMRRDEVQDYIRIPETRRNPKGERGQNGWRSMIRRLQNKEIPIKQANLMKFILVNPVIHESLRFPPLRRHEALAVHHGDFLASAAEPAARGSRSYLNFDFETVRWRKGRAVVVVANQRGLSSSFVSVGGRQRFTVELRPGETTIVSWKKLVKDATKVAVPISVPEPPADAHPALEARLAPGKHSSDEEDLNDVPDDDEYDTEDSFIDDTELDEYFQVDNSAIKHDGFFVNRGKLERINEPTSLANQQPKKRRRKDGAKDHGEGDDGHVPNKHLKVGKKATGKSDLLVGKSTTVPSHVVALPSVHHIDMKFQNQMNSSVVGAKNKSAETKTSVDPPPSKVSNGDASLSLAVEKDVDKQKTGIAPSMYQGNKLKDGGEVSDASVQRSHDKSSYVQSKSQAGKLSNNFDELDQAVQWREKDGIRERPDLNVTEGKYSTQITKTPLMQRKESSNVRPKSTMLEKAIKELEKMVADSRPPASEAQDADISSQAVKRRLPREVKQKLAKVARVAQANHGKISKELVNRLMSILGHMMQLRTLKALEQQAGASDDFQEIGNEEKEVIKRKCSMDDVLEDKICGLYDLFVEGLDEDAGPQVRKLYAELAALWPDGFMNNHGIKRAICRAKDRKRALYRQHKDQENVKKKKLLIQKTEETVRVETTSIAQPQCTQEKLVIDSNNHGSTSLVRPLVSATVTNVSARAPSTSLSGPTLERPRLEKVKGSSSNPNEARTMDALTKKKVKRKPESELGETHFRLEKLGLAPGEDRHKPRKQVVAPPPKRSLPAVVAAAAAPPQNFEQPS
ncbi:wound-responsive family protein [Actinidia rufa]|uniref:Wound-responsive family protein n=1 Tax=Actinidia rufa TaxID=165716 RepID=A0A7J0EGH9_9ERIC|nr:wound-responsive family protein [Actinidia rufa]